MLLNIIIVIAGIIFYFFVGFILCVLIEPVDDEDILIILVFYPIAIPFAMLYLLYHFVTHELYEYAIAVKREVLRDERP